MSDAKKELFNSLTSPDEKSVHFSQLGSIQEASLAQLREQIKKVMIPLLIKTFQCQLDLISFSQEDSSSEDVQDTPLKEAYAQLRTLDHDLKNLQLWCQSCRSQIQRALTPPDEEQKTRIATPDLKAHPGIAKSFSKAMAVKSCPEELSSSPCQESSSPPSPSLPKAWWKILLRK